MKPLNPTTRGLIVGLSGFFAAGLTHSLLPAGDTLSRAAMTALTCIVVSTLVYLGLRSTKR